MRSFRQLLLSTFLFTTCYHIGHGQDDTTTDKQNSIKSTIPAEMKITSWNDMPFSGLAMENGKWVGKGYAFYLLELLSSKLNFTYTIVPPKEHVLGNKRRGILKLLHDRTVDMAVAFLPLLPELREYCTFSTALDHSEITALMKRPQESTTGTGLLAPFDRTVWLSVLAAALTTMPVIYIFARFRAKLWNDQNSENYSFPSCIWFVFCSMLKQGTSMVATTDSTRILFATWWIFILILTSFYTANLTAFLTKPQFTLPIKNIDDIVRKGYRWVAFEGRTIDYLLSQHHLDELSAMNSTRLTRGNFISTYEYPVKDIFNAVKNNKLFLGETHYLESLLFENYINKTREQLSYTNRCTYVLMPGALRVINRAFAFPVNSTIVKPINEALMALVETGIIKREKLKNLPLAHICPLDLQSTERRLSFKDLSLTFKLVVIGYAIATIVFILELTLRWGANVCKRRKETNSVTLRRPKQRSVFVTPQLVNFTKNNLSDGKRNNLQKISPRPMYQTIPYGIAQGKKQTINGRDYYVVMDRSGDQRLIPIRTPSAFLFQYTA
ncbi:glutamate receptor ionotropic, delta-1 [Pseudomyrmex gracilis]|uniref:glutamate receptor ionotropic, delta-1 n=1 Tax=Pseudomyrmex gracilis TaxID=219809 RepID=UPI00099597E9|nr:glutamate receptor ionotropic, delta-1 [Pseudomyrmex gracilis]